MSSFFKAAVFSLAVIGVFTVFAVWYVPDTSVTMPPSAGTGGAVSGGEAIFYGKGNCALCHDKRLNRAPALDNIAVTALERLKDARYKGKATNAEEYVYESMVNPSAYVVAGYGVTGSGDTISPMPEAGGRAIGLTEDEIKAVAGFILSSEFH